MPLPSSSATAVLHWVATINHPCPTRDGPIIDARQDDETETSEDVELDFSKKKKKKAKQPVPALVADADKSTSGGGGEPPEAPNEKSPTGSDDGMPRADAEGDEPEQQRSSPDQTAATGSHEGGMYSYAYLLTRLRDTLRVDQPAHPSLRSDKQRSHVPPPKLARVGGRRVGICNFGTICAALHRPPEHAQSFLLSELATTGALDAAAETLTVLAALQTKQAEQLIKRYVQEYVLCGQCRALETVMVKGKGRAEILRCSCCSAERLLPPIKSGFIAVRRGERRANRNQ